MSLAGVLNNPEVTVTTPINFDSAGFDPSKLSRFYAGLPGIATNGGRDVLFIGDSLFEGTGASDGSLYSWARLIGQGLQQWANRKWAPSIKGGIGFVSAYASAGVTNTTVVNSGTFAGGTPAAFNGQTGFALLRIDSGASGTSVLTTNWISDLEFVYQKRMTAVTVAWAVTGTGAASGSLVVGDTNKGPLYNTTQFTTNTNGIYGERKALITGVTPSATNSVCTISAPNTDNVRFNGFICYNGDRIAGLRYHNLGRSGWMLYGPANNTCIMRADTALGVDYDNVNFDTSVAVKSGIQANIDQWTYAASTDAATGVNVGSCRGGLVVLELLTNDQSNYGNADAATAASGLVTYQSFCQELITRILARPSLPSVLLVIPPCPGGRETYYRVFKQAMYNLASANANVAVFDVDAYFGQASSRPFPRTWENDSVGSEIHPTTLGAIGWASPVLEAIIAGCPY